MFDLEGIIEIYKNFYINKKHEEVEKLLHVLKDINLKKEK